MEQSTEKNIEHTVVLKLAGKDQFLADIDVEKAAVLELKEALEAVNKLLEKISGRA